MSITQGFSVDCTTAECCGGGIDYIWIANAKDVDINAITRDINNKVDSLPMVAAAVFYEFETQPETSTLAAPSKANGCCAIHDIGITFVMKCIEQLILDTYKEITSSCCGFVVIYKQSNGKRFVFGLESPRNAIFTEGNLEIGATLEDANQVSITLKAKQLNPMEELDAALVIPV